jgi:phytoene dehydrogenase-like protein
VEFVTVADYRYFADLLRTDKRQYRKIKREVMDSILDVFEEHYVPGFRKFVDFKTGGTPTTNERYCLSPMGNSYGSNMTPQHIGLGRLKAESSVPGLYFCNASSGFAGFAGTFWTGAALFQKLSGNRVL